MSNGLYYFVIIVNVIIRWCCGRSHGPSVTRDSPASLASEGATGGTGDPGPSGLSNGPVVLCTHSPGRVSGLSPVPSAHLPGLLGSAEWLLILHSLCALLGVLFLCLSKAALSYLLCPCKALIQGIIGREAGRTLGRRTSFLVAPSGQREMLGELRFRDSE